MQAVTIFFTEIGKKSLTNVLKNQSKNLNRLGSFYFAIILLNRPHKLIV